MNVAEEAAGLVDGDRQATYGDPRETARRLALGFSAVLGVTVHPWQVPLLLQVLKVVRAGRNPGHRDNQVDGCGYWLLAERIGDDTWPADFFTASSGESSAS